MKKVLSLMLALAMAFSLAACGSSSSSTESSGGTTSGSGESTSSDTVKFAVVGPMTGQDAEYGLGFRQAAQIMADRWNENGGVNGKQIELVVYDDKGTAEESANVAEQIVANDEIVAVVGHFASSCSMAAAPIYQEHGMLEISPCSSHADFTSVGDWIWRVSPLSSDESRTVARIVTEYFEADKVGILIMNTDWGVESATLQQEYLRELNPDVEIVTETVVEGNDDYSSVVTNFQNAGIEAVVCCSTYTVTAPFLNQMRDAMPGLPAVAHGNCQVQQVIDILGDNAEGLVCSCAWSHIFTDEESQYFTEKYTAMDPNGNTPIGDYAQYYDTLGVLLQACENVGSFDREAIRQELATIEYDGLSGHLKFDENRDCPRDYGAVIVENGEWVQLDF